jgi:hypothetical protein
MGDRLFQFFNGGKRGGSAQFSVLIPFTETMRMHFLTG